MLAVRHVQRHRARYKQATGVGLLLAASDDDGGRGQVLSASTDDRRLLITVYSQRPCVQRDGRPRAVI